MEIDALFAGLLGALDAGVPGLSWRTLDDLRDPRWIEALVRQWPAGLEAQVRAAVSRAAEWVEEFGLAPAGGPGVAAD
jgi:hypothetical protein